MGWIVFICPQIRDQGSNLLIPKTNGCPSPMIESNLVHRERNIVVNKVCHKCELFFKWIHSIPAFLIYYYQNYDFDACDAHIKNLFKLLFINVNALNMLRQWALAQMAPPSLARGRWQWDPRFKTHWVLV